MPIIHPPKIVQNAVDEFLAPLFKNKPQRKHLANYLTGLMISENKTIAGMTAEMPNASDQSCLNRFLTEVEWDEHAVNQARIDWLQQFDDTKFHPRGVIAIDDVLLDKTGKFIKDSGTFWDHSEQRYKHAQDLIIVNYVHPTSGKHYPLEFKRFKKENQCEWIGEEFKKMTTLTVELIDWCHEKKVLGNFTFDSFYTCAEIQNHIHALKNEDGTERGYVGDLKFNRKLTFKGVEQQAVEFARTIPPSDRKPVTVDGIKQWYLSVCVKMPNIDHKVRVVILWRYKNDAEPRKILVTNKIHWNAERIIETYRGRWTGTETFHRDGKQELGLGDCQLRDGEGQTRHTYMVFLAYSLLVRELDKTSVSGWASVKLSTIGESRRALLRESIRTMIGWIVGEGETVARSGGNVSRRLGTLLDRLGLGPITQR
jgi:Transposase DDE domain.